MFYSWNTSAYTALVPSYTIYSVDTAAATSYWNYTPIGISTLLTVVHGVYIASTHAGHCACTNLKKALST